MSTLQDHLNEKLLADAKVYPPHRGKTKTSQEKVGKFVDRPGEIAGEKRIVKGWLAIGRNVRGDVLCLSTLADNISRVSKTSFLAPNSRKVGLR